MKTLNVGPQAMKGLKDKLKDGSEDKPSDGAFDAMLALMQSGQNLPKVQGPLTTMPGQGGAQASALLTEGAGSKLAQLQMPLGGAAIDLRAAILAPQVDGEVVAPAAMADSLTQALAELSAPHEAETGEAESLDRDLASLVESMTGDKPETRAHGHVAAAMASDEHTDAEAKEEPREFGAEVEVPQVEAQALPEHALKQELKADAPAPSFEPSAPAPMTRADAPTPTPEVERAMDMRAVQFSAEQGVTVQHPELGEMSLAVTRQRGKVEVDAMVQSDDGARIVQANERGMRMSVQAVGFPFGGLKVRVADREARDRKATLGSREPRAERRRSK